MKYKEQNPRKKQKNSRKKKHYGVRPKSKQPNDFNNFWSIDIPPNFDQFKNKCLFLSVIFGNLQNCYFENSRDKRFLYAQNIRSSNKLNYSYAQKILEKELNKLLIDLNLENTNEYVFEEIAPLLSNYFKSQIFIFTGNGIATKILEMYPKEYDDSLKPIFLYQPLNTPNHLIFIRHIISFFRANCTICFACKKKFKTVNYKHDCLRKKTCYCCKRFISSSNTYLNKTILPAFFCNSKENESTIICNKCNFNIPNLHCLSGHKKVCNRAWKCPNCKKVTFRSGGKNNSIQKIIELHKCGFKVCRFCKVQYKHSLDEIHLCPLKKIILSPQRTKLAYLGLEFLNHCTDNCAQCYLLRKAFCTEQNLTWLEMTKHTLFPTLHCEVHAHQNNLYEPNIIIIYRECLEPFKFEKVIISDFICSNSDNIDFDLKFNKMHFQQKYPKFEPKFFTNRIFEADSFVKKTFLETICSKEWHGTTFVCQDQDSLILVSKTNKIK